MYLQFCKITTHLKFNPIFISEFFINDLSISRELEEKVKADQHEVDTYEQNKSDFNSSRSDTL